MTRGLFWPQPIQRWCQQHALPAAPMIPGRPRVVCSAFVPGSDSQRSTGPSAKRLLASLSSWPWPQVMEVQSDVRLCTVTEGLTEDAVSARLVQGGPSLHLRPISPTLKQWLIDLPCSISVPRVSSTIQAYLSIRLEKAACCEHCALSSNW